MSKHIGEIIGVFKIAERMDYKDDDGHALYKGICIYCGFKRIARLYDLKYTKECTHIRIDGEIAFNSINWDDQRLRGIFSGMKQRCYNPNEKSYRWYGAKGIKICDEWMDNPKLFEDWSFANGYSDGLTIDRIDENKDYCPENCRWITQIDNSKYKSTTHNLCVNNEAHSGKDWARILGIGSNTVNRYIRKYGLDNTIMFIEKVLEDPELKYKLKPKQSYYSLYMN